MKGIYNEISFAYRENHDEDAIKAILFESTNHPDSDLILFNIQTGEREYVQLKASDNISYVQDALEKNPQIRVITTQELADKLGIDSTGVSNEQLNQEVERTINNLHDHHQLLDYIPQATFWSTVFSLVPIMQQYVKNEISKQECVGKIAQITGYKTVRVIALMLL